MGAFDVLAGGNNWCFRFCSGFFLFLVNRGKRRHGDAAFAGGNDVHVYVVVLVLEDFAFWHASSTGLLLLGVFKAFTKGTLKNEITRNVVKFSLIRVKSVNCNYHLF